MKVEERILSNLENLIAQYEAELTFLQNRSMNKFDTTQLPKVIQNMVKLATAKTPSFSNISAVAVSNFVLSHLFGQIRLVINDPIYSDDKIGINTYSIIISRSGCVDADTEFCTPNGWKRISEFKLGDKVLSWKEDGSSEFVLPTGYIKGEAKTLTHYKSGSVDMVLSEDHNMALLNKSGKYLSMQARDFKAKHLQSSKGSNYGLPFKFSHPNNNNLGLVLTDNEIRLFIAYVADGTIQNYGRDKSSNLVRIRVKKEHKKERLRQLLTEVYGTVDERVTKSEPEYSRFYFPPVRGMTTKTFDDLWHLSKEQAEVAADEFWRWDGGIDPRNGTKMFRTTKKSEADLVQFIWQSIYDTVVTINTSERHDKTPFHTEYQVLCTQSKSIGFRSKEPESLISDYNTVDGFQYCFTMPNSNWVARRNNKIFLTKNSGKDSTYQALSKAVSEAHELIASQHLLELEEKAKQKFIRDAKKTTPDLDESTVTREAYEHLIDKPETTIASLGSTRGGLTTSLNRMAKHNFGIKSLFASELGLAIQSNSSIVEVLELFSTLYDMGESVSPEFKTQESKEESVNGMFPNLLGISSPAPFYTEGNVRKLLVPMLTTSLARRVNIVFSNASEEFENEYIPENPTERREIQAKARVVLKEYTEELNKHFVKCVKHALADPVIMFDDEAQYIYDDYKSYTQDLSKYLLLKDGDSVEGIEMSGRAFKMGRIAAVWTLAQNKRIIDAETLKAAIYFCDYTAQHLSRFAHTLELKDYEIFINDWEQGFIDNVLPVDQAITKGYISTKHLHKGALENFLKPVNSKLEGIATVSYNDKTNAFVFVPVIKDLGGDYSYRAIQGHLKETPIPNICRNRAMEALGGLLKVNSSVNPFVEDTTNFVILTVEHSFLSMEMLSKYLSKTNHFIATSKDSSNHHAFTLMLPVNSVIKKEDYKYVSLSIANQLMIRIAPEMCEWDVVHFGYDGSTILEATQPANLFDISGVLGNLASGADVPLLSIKPATKPNPATIAKYLQDDILEYKQVLIDMLNASSNPLLLFATIVYDMKVHYVSDDKILDLIDNVNSSLIKSIDEQTKQTYLIEPFVNL